MRLSGLLSRPTISLCIVLISPLCAFVSTRGQQPPSQEPTLGLEIKLPDGQMIRRYPVRGRTEGQVVRSDLRVKDVSAAGDFTAIDMLSEIEAGAIRVNVSVIYNDLRIQEWWKDKKQKPAGSHLIHEGESIRTAGLAKFGIEPLELRVVDARSVVVGSSEKPFITNKTQSLQVVRLERSLDDYKLSLKNIGDKTIVGFNILHRGSYDFSGNSWGGFQPGSGTEVYFVGSDIEELGITIPGVVFEDGSFEGDAQKEALDFLVDREGQRIQAPSVLARIVQTMKVPDDELPAACEKLEVGLRTIPEAIDKSSALELLKSQYAYLDDKSISELYEKLKGGLYEARNLALTPLGKLKRFLQEDQRLQNSADKVATIRYLLTRIKADLEKIIGAQTK